MSTRLRAALHEAAEEVTGYDVLPGAIAAGRRRRRRAFAASGLAVLAVLGLVAAVAIPALPDSDDPAHAPAAPSIPEVIGPPAPFTPNAASSPPGRASVIFSGHQGDLVVVGATADSYRIIDTDAEPGWDALLSPTGDRVAYADRDGVRVVDLGRGGARTYPSERSTVDGFAPAAWLPDGTGLVVLSTTEADDPTTQGIVKELAILDLATGALDEFAEATWPIATPGFAVAVSPDGARIAYQFSDFVTVYDRPTRAKTRFDVDSLREVLAGRSAWAPDGSLVLLRQTWDGIGYRWRLRWVDPTTGAPRGTTLVPDGWDLVRLIGWSGQDPVVVGYQGAGGGVMCCGSNTVLWSGFDGTVGVYLLADGSTRELVQPNGRINFIDVMEEALADPQTRPGDPPWALPPSNRWVPIFGLLVIAWAIGIVIAAWLRARRSPPPTVSPPAAGPDRS